MKKTVKGSFEVKATPQPTDETLTKVGAGRMTFDKKFEGPLTGTGIVSMIGMMNAELKSGAYVALEKVIGALEGRRGEFCICHCSTMDRGVPSQKISVVPDSGTGDLTGLKGDFKIDIVDGKHFYELTYEL